MGKSIRDYNTERSKSDKKGGNTRDKIERDVGKDYEKYNRMNENQLMNELEREVVRLKEQGVLTPQMLDAFYNQMSGSMSPEQRKRLKALINTIK